MSQENTYRKQSPLPDDLRVFLTVVRKHSFVAAAEELGQSPAYISKRIQILESSLHTRLLHRTTRSLALTEDGERAHRWALQILSDLDGLMDDLSQAHHTPRGLLHVCSSFGFGRNQVAPALSLLAEQYPELEIRLDVYDRAVDIISEGFDLEIRVGDDLPEQHICKQLASNRRVLCASPEYLERRGTPTTLRDLEQHSCLVLKERNTSFGIWNLSPLDGKATAVKVQGALSSNNGEIVLQWALDGCGIVLRSMWDVKKHLEQGRLVQILPNYSQSANVWAVYPTRLSHSAKLRVCVEFLTKYFKRLE
ncbi:Positive regulator of Tartrate dehydrogenase/decarboxylase/D-malic enzyme [Marinobacterium lacunae]|uniref:Positive regulator of Tartrate dehydrogenase/decarboxylase/D-malic enzyme n=1 Tax=Marinobacterium lacunae TaxID=1232683 RepID=A0A081FUD5_9GAMM|nr:LysR substrate-binding domain-containing protein [Marinobacterium lacunae]KEA62140.1 Positive regulator of Tartrate dehydrogenase/decarboxylase/D-malic enzyme [Marinobacterium lacunae]